VIASATSFARLIGLRLPVEALILDEPTANVDRDASRRPALVRQGA
jgi:DNA repair exonuclease SbcCD ATPase subunit